VTTTLVCDGASGEPTLEQAMADHFVRCHDIFKARQRKYGSGNIARRGPVGVLVRMDDKLARLDQLVMQGKGATESDESIADTCYDIVNYALILLTCEQGQWPGWTKKCPTA